MGIDILKQIVAQVAFNQNFASTGVIDISGIAGLGADSYGVAPNDHGRVVPLPVAVAGLIRDSSLRLAELLCSVESSQGHGALDVLLARNHVELAEVGLAGVDGMLAGASNRRLAMFVITHPSRGMCRVLGSRIQYRLEAETPDLAWRFHEVEPVGGAWSQGVVLAFVDWAHRDAARMLLASLPLLDPRLRHCIEEGCAAHDWSACSVHPSARLSGMAIEQGGGMERHMSSIRAIEHRAPVGLVLDVAWPGAGVLVGVMADSSLLRNCPAAPSARAALTSAWLERSDVLKHCSQATAIAAVSRLMRDDAEIKISPRWIDEADRCAWVRASWNGQRTRRQIANFIAVHLGEDSH